MATSLIAGSGPVLADGAVVIQGTQCYAFDGNGSLTLVDGMTQRVLAADPSGINKYTCNASGLTPPASGQAVDWTYQNTGVLCSTMFGVTEDWSEEVTPSGHATLSCFINPNPTP